MRDFLFAVSLKPLQARWTIYLTTPLFWLPTALAIHAARTQKVDMPLFPD